MAGSISPLEKFALSPRTPATIAQAPNSGSARVLKTPLSEETLWKRLGEAGFDEESIKLRDKATLIAYISKLDAEIHDHQYHMGILILERKDLLAKYEEAKSQADSVELKFKREEASYRADLANAKKREDSLKKALGIERECVKNIEKTLHEMRVEYAEGKVAAESKLEEARSMMEDAQKKLKEAEDKFRAAESLEAEAKRFHRTAERKLHEFEEREDDLRRRILSSQADFEAKERDFQLERQSLSERQKHLQRMLEEVLDAKALHNQREEYISNKTQELEKFEKELEDKNISIEKERMILNEEKLTLELKASSLSAREEAVIRDEYDLLKKQEEVLILQAKAASKKSDNVQQVISDREATFAAKISAVEAELEMKRKLVEEESIAKMRDWELRELDIKQWEGFVSEREHEVNIESRRLQESKKELEERQTVIEEKEKYILAASEKLDADRNSLKQIEDEINKRTLDLEKSYELLEEKRKHINEAEEKAEAIRSETNALQELESRLKEEVDQIMEQKQELEFEADQLKAEKAKFEAEWELIDEKRQELAKEAERIAEEKLTISKFLTDERENLKAEKDMMWEEYKCELESLSRDREAFRSQIMREHTELFSKIQKERADYLLDIEIQKKELENRIEKRREEIENYLNEKEKEFEEEKRKELQRITSLKERAGREQEHVDSEMRRLDAERREINLDRERRGKEWAELNNAIEELKVQKEKLEKQRELLRADREEIIAQTVHLQKLEELKDRLDSIAVHEMHQASLQSNKLRQSSKRSLKPQNKFALDHNGSITNAFGQDNSAVKESDKSASPLSAPFSWLKRCADTLLEQSQSKKKRKENGVMPLGPEDNPLWSPENSNISDTEHVIKPANQAPLDAETTVYIDKIIRIQGVTTVDVEKEAGDSEEAAIQQYDDNGGTGLETKGKF